MIIKNEKKVLKLYVINIITTVKCYYKLREFNKSIFELFVIT